MVQGGMARIQNAESLLGHESCHQHCQLPLPNPKHFCQVLQKGPFALHVSQDQLRDRVSQSAILLMLFILFSQSATTACNWP